MFHKMIYIYAGVIWLFCSCVSENPAGLVVFYTDPDVGESNDRGDSDTDAKT